MPPRYKAASDCRKDIRDYINHLEAATDDRDPELRDETSTKRYAQDLRWYDEWLDEQGIDSPSDVTSDQASSLGIRLSNEFSGTTGRYRWDRIFAFHSWLNRMNRAKDNPLEKWHEGKEEEFGLTKSTEQHLSLEEGEEYAVSQQEVRLMEENVGRHKHRDQLVIRLLWQTGIRRGEASQLLMSDVDRDSHEITIRPSVAKNDQKRVIAYQPSLDGVLKEWLDFGRREEMAAGASHDRLFVGQQEGLPLSGDRINDIAREAAIDAGINRRLYADANAPVDEDGNKQENRWKITAHSVRHGFGTWMVNETDAGLWEVSKIMGHSSVDVTEDIYVEPDPRSGIKHAHQYGPD